jgi:hypothetical protein
MELRGNLGYLVRPDRRRAELAGLLLSESARGAWRAFIRADTPYDVDRDPLPPPRPTSDDQVVDFLRLVLAGDWTDDAWRRARPSTRATLSDGYRLAAAVAEPFVPALWDRLPRAARDDLLGSMQQTWTPQAPVWRALLGWTHRLDASALRDLSPGVRRVAAEDAMHRGDLAALDRLVDGLGGPSIEQVRAGLLARQGRWADAVSRFDTALKALRQHTGARRGLVPRTLLHWHLLALMASGETTGWAAARKLAINDAGSKEPDPRSGLGLWAHALGLRLGDAAPLAGVFDAPRSVAEASADDLADRLILAAWTGEPARGWTAEHLRGLCDVLVAVGLPWPAALAIQAAERLGVPLPPDAAAVRDLWPVRYFPDRQDGWRDALAAIRALGDDAGGTGALAEATPPMLEWWLTLDAYLRPVALAPMERPRGARGPGRPRAVPLSRLRKSQRLDPLDAAVARAITPSPWRASDLHLDLAAAVPALLRHPGLRLADQPDQSVELVDALPRLEVRRETPAGDEATDGSPALAALRRARPGISSCTAMPSPVRTCRATPGCGPSSCPSATACSCDCVSSRSATTGPCSWRVRDAPGCSPAATAAASARPAICRPSAPTARPRSTRCRSWTPRRRTTTPG